MGQSCWSSTRKPFVDISSLSSHISLLCCIACSYTEIPVWSSQACQDPDQDHRFFSKYIYSLWELYEDEPSIIQPLIMSSSQSRSSSPCLSSAEDESYQLALTVLSLPPTPLRPPSSPIFGAPIHSNFSSASMARSQSEYSGMSSSSDDERPTYSRANTSSHRRRKRKPVQAGLSNLNDPPCPFGSQLGTHPARPQPSRSTPYSQAYTREFFDPHPSNRALKVENMEIPRPDPEDALETILSAWKSIKNLALSAAQCPAGVITDQGRKPLEQQLVKGAALAIIVLRPRWVLAGMNWSYGLLKDPFRAFHHSVYVWVISQHVLH